MKNLGKIGDPEDLVTKKYVDDLFSGGDGCRGFYRRTRNLRNLVLSKME